MRIGLYLFSVLVFALASCGDDTLSHNDGSSPFIFHTVSRDGAMIACFRSATPFSPVEAHCISNTITGQRHSIDFEAALPSDIQLVDFYPAAAWCPYDNDKLLLHSLVRIDTSETGYRYAYGMMLYSLASRTATLMELDNFPGPQQYVQWLHGSSAEADSILLSPLQSIYIPQIDTLLSLPYEHLFYTYYSTPLQSPDGRYYIFPTADEMPVPFPSITHLQLNENAIRLPEPVLSAVCAGWSPDSRRLLLAIRDGANRPGLRIADIDRATREPSVLHWDVVRLPPTVSAVHSSSFLTNSTLAVAFAIKKDGPVYLWEMTPGGDILRMLLPIP